MPAPNLFTPAGGNVAETYKVRLPAPLRLIIFKPGGLSGSVFASESFEVPSGEHILIRIKNPLGLPNDLLVIKKMYDEGQIVGMVLCQWQHMAQMAKCFGCFDEWRITLSRLPSIISLPSQESPTIVRLGEQKKVAASS